MESQFIFKMTNQTQFEVNNLSTLHNSFPNSDVFACRYDTAPTRIKPVTLDHGPTQPKMNDLFELIRLHRVRICTLSTVWHLETDNVTFSHVLLYC